MKRNAALVVAFLCAFAFVMPWGAVVSDPFYIHTYSILASSLLVIACYTVSRAGWAIDGYYHYHDEFMICAFILELLFISASIKKVAAVWDGITSFIRRSFISLVRLYPSERGGINLSNDKEHHQC